MRCLPKITGYATPDGDCFPSAQTNADNYRQADYKHFL